MRSHNRILLLKLLRDFRERIGPLSALIVIVTIGTGFHIAMASLYRDLDRARHQYFTEYQLCDFVIELKRVPINVIRRLTSIPNVETVSGRVHYPIVVNLDDRDEPISGVAISAPHDRRPILNGLQMRTGTWFSARGRGEVIVNHDFARHNGLRPGDTIGALLLDQLYTLTVVGTAISPEFVYLVPSSGGLAPDPKNFGVLYLEESFLQKRSNLDGGFNQILGIARDRSDEKIAAMFRDFDRILAPYGLTQSVKMSDKASIRFLYDELNGLRLNTIIMPLIFLGVASLVLNIVVKRLVEQQRTVIGTLRAVGYTKTTIMGHFMGFGMLLGVLGAGCGIVFGIVLQHLFIAIYRQFYSLPDITANPYPALYLSGIGICLIFTALGTVKGVHYAMSLDPAEAMRPAFPELGKRILLERLLPAGNWLSHREKMIVRSIFRNPYRSTVGVFGAALATSIVIVTLGTKDSFEYLVDYEFSQLMHQDVTLTYREPRGKSVIHAASWDSRLNVVEPQLVVPCDLAFDGKRKHIAITGLSESQLLYTPRDQSGRRIYVPEEGLVISRKLADILGVGIGDLIVLRPLIGARRRVHLPISDIADTYLGLTAYARIPYLSRLLGETWSANLILGQLSGPASRLPLLNTVKKQPSLAGFSDRRHSINLFRDTIGQSMGLMITVFVFIAGTIAFGSVLNSALVSVSGCQREIATFRVLGYSVRQVSYIISGESLLINGVGIILGIPMGIGLIHLIMMAYNTELYRFPTIINQTQLILSALIMTVFVVIAQILIYRIIRKFNWFNVLNVRE